MKNAIKSLAQSLFEAFKEGLPEALFLAGVCVLIALFTLCLVFLIMINQGWLYLSTFVIFFVVVAVLIGRDKIY